MLTADPFQQCALRIYKVHPKCTEQLHQCEKITPTQTKRDLGENAKRNNWKPSLNISNSIHAQICTGLMTVSHFYLFSYTPRMQISLETTS